MKILDKIGKLIVDFAKSNFGINPLELLVFFFLLYVFFCALSIFDGKYFVSLFTWVLALINYVGGYRIWKKAKKGEVEEYEVCS